MERKVISLAPHNKCTGCAACSDACTKQCISFSEENGFDLEASDNIQQSFIKLCREKYPLAKKNSDFVFTIKRNKTQYH